MVQVKGNSLAEEIFWVVGQSKQKIAHTDHGNILFWELPLFYLLYSECDNSIFTVTLSSKGFQFFCIFMLSLFNCKIEMMQKILKILNVDTKSSILESQEQAFLLGVHTSNCLQQYSDSLCSEIKWITDIVYRAHCAQVNFAI